MQDEFHTQMSIFFGEMLAPASDSFRMISAADSPLMGDQRPHVLGK
jgi:hypothetical protein